MRRLTHQRPSVIRTSRALPEWAWGALAAIFVVGVIAAAAVLDDPDTHALQASRDEVEFARGVEEGRRQERELLSRSVIAAYTRGKVAGQAQCVVASKGRP